MAEVSEQECSAVHGYWERSAVALAGAGRAKFNAWTSRKSNSNSNSNTDAGFIAAPCPPLPPSPACAALAVCWLRGRPGDPSLRPATSDALPRGRQWPANIDALPVNSDALPLAEICSVTLSPGAGR